MGSITHIALGRPNPTIQGVRTNRHHIGLYFCSKAFSKGRNGSSLVAMGAHKMPAVMRTFGTG
eukprot:402479-Pelagomonas_calceolata.AAC.1